MAEKEVLLQQVMPEHTEKLLHIAYYYVRNT